MPCRSDGCRRRPPQDRGRQSRPQRLSWGCRQLRPGRRADARHGGSDRSAGTDDRASPSRPKQRSAGRSSGRGGKAAGPGGDLWAFQASRCLLGPLIVSRASQWGCGSRRASPAAPRGLHGRHAGPGRRRSPGSVHPSFHLCSHPSVFLSTYPSVFPSVYPPIHPSMLPPPRPIHPCTHASLHSGPALPASQPACCLARLDFGDPAPRRYARGCGARSSCAVGHRGLRRAGTASAAASGSNTQGPILLGSAQPYVKSASTQQPPAHSGAERPATANNRNSVRVYYGCEPGEKKKVI